MSTMFRLSLRIQRFEVLAVALAALVVSGFAVFARIQLDAAGATTACFDEWFLGAGPNTTGPCGAAMRKFFEIDNALAAPVMSAAAFLPLVAGLLLGVGLVARDIETGTAGPVWALARSRLVWLGMRTAPLIAVLVVALGVCALASDFLTVGRQPWVHGPSFADSGAHGPALVARGLAAFALALLVGSILGRTLPAVIVGAVLLAAFWVGGEVARYRWLSDEARNHLQDKAVNAYTLPGGTGFDSYSIAADGALMTDAEAYALAPPDVDPVEWVAANFRGVNVGIPGSEYPRWLAIELVEYLAIAGIAGALAGVVVERRRPR